MEPIPPRFCQSDAASDDLRWAADRDERMNPYGDPLSIYLVESIDFLEDFDLLVEDNWE